MIGNTDRHLPNARTRSDLASILDRRADIELQQGHARTAEWLSTLAADLRGGTAR